MCFSKLLLWIVNIVHSFNLCPLCFFFHCVRSRASLSTHQQASRKRDRDRQRKREMNRCVLFCTLSRSLQFAVKQIVDEKEKGDYFKSELSNEISRLRIFFMASLSPSASSFGSNHIDCNSKICFFPVYSCKCSVIFLFRSCSIDVIAVNKHTEILINWSAANTISHFYRKSDDFCELHIRIKITAEIIAVAFFYSTKRKVQTTRLAKHSFGIFLPD